MNWRDQNGLRLFSTGIAYLFNGIRRISKFEVEFWLDNILTSNFEIILSALSDEFIDKLFDAADGNNDGTIDFDEFIKIVTKMIANDFTDILGWN